MQPVVNYAQQFFIPIPGCTAQEFACADLTKCIAVRDTCNYRTECDDGSDELPLNIACGSNRFSILIYLRYLYFIQNNIRECKMKMNLYFITYVEIQRVLATKSNVVPIMLA